MKVWFFNLEERLEDNFEIFSPGAGEGSGDIFPHPKSWSNKDICPSSLFIHISHLLNDTDLLQKQAGAFTG